MEEIEIPNLFAGFKTERLAPVPIIREPVGVVVKIDNEDDFKHNFDKEGEVDVFTQMLSQIVGERYRNNRKIERCTLIPYKQDGDIIFSLNDVKVGKLYDNYVLVCHFEYNSTVS